MPRCTRHALILTIAALITVTSGARANAGSACHAASSPRVTPLIVHVRAQTKPGAASAVVDVAYSDSGLVSDVAAGENHGARLVHDHVVRSLHRAGRVRDGALAATITLPRPAERGTHPTIVAFVQREANGNVLQAIALPLDRC